MMVPVTFDSDVTGESTDAETGIFFPPTLYITHALRPHLHVGLGLFIPYGLSTEWPNDWEGRYSTTFSEINAYYMNPNIAWSPTDRFRVAVGISYVPSEVTLINRMELTPAPDGEVKIDATGTGLGYNLAILAALPGNNQVGISYRSPVKIDFDGEADLAFPDPSLNFGTGISSDLTLPPSLVIGLAHQALERYTFEFDVQWTGWSRFRKITIAFDDPSIPDSVTEKKWKNTYALRFGVERRTGPLVIRAGYAFDETPVPSDTLDPSIPDADKHSFSFGGGYRWGKAKIDLAYMIILFNDRKANNTLQTGGTPFAQNGTYSTTVHEVGLSISYSF
jgi:long-chain fatty acid transport protein